MKINNFLINITSEDPERLKAFYGQTIGLDKNPDMGEDAFYAGGRGDRYRRAQRDQGCGKGAAARAHRLLRR